VCRSAIFKITPENVDLLDRDIGNIDRHTSTEECCKMSGNFTVPGEGHCGACRKTWRLTDTDLCPCGETQTMSHIVESCPLTKLNGGLSQLHSTDDDGASAWLTNYRS